MREFYVLLQREMPSYKIQIEQSTPDRVKHSLQPIKYDVSFAEITQF